MATTRITDSILNNISKGPLVIFVMFGVAVWQASSMSSEQLDTIERIIGILNNSVGAAIYLAILLLLIYALVLYPSGKFVATISQEFIEMQKGHNSQHNEHVEASKKMYHTVNDIQAKCDTMQTKLEKFYGTG